MKLADVNGVVGRPAQGEGDYPRVADILAHMDLLGIGQTVVWNPEARQNHSLSSNQKLIDEIKSVSAAKNRVIPGLVVSGTILYERDGLRKLENQLRDGGTRALRYVNALGRCSLSQIEPVVRALLPHKPFIVLRNDEAAPQEILDFAAALPDVPLVLTEVVWGSFSKVLDLMRRRGNILIETSWLHTTGVLEVLVKHFGADRVVFGTSYRSRNGAAIAELARAEISGRDRQLIACGNLERLLGRVFPETSALAAGKNSSVFWRNCLSGEKIGVEIIDAHGHIGPSAGYILEAQTEQDQAQLAIRQMDSLGISSMLVSGLQALLGEPVPGNDLLEQVLSPYGGRFKGYVGFNPLYADELVTNFDRWFSGSFFVGFKTLCDYWRVPNTDPRFKPMWDYAQAHRLPVLMHTWGNSAYDGPAIFKDLVKEYPDISFIFGHSGGTDPGRRDMEVLAEDNPNVYMEWCGSFCSTIRWEDTLNRIPARQIVYGSDAMAHSLNWELGRLLSVDAPDSVIEPILAANIRQILACRM